MKTGILSYILAFLILISCTSGNSKPVIVATSYPIYSILTEIAGNKAEVVCLVPPGASPHTYQPKPSDMYKVQTASIFFYVAENADGWAAKFNTKKTIKLMDLLPKEFVQNYTAGELIEATHLHNDSCKHEKGDVDPHFWTDPLTVKALLPILADSLAAVDPANAQTYRTNAKLFGQRLDLLNKQVSDIVKNLKGKAVFLFHPSMNYFLNRYSLSFAGAIETSPGKEPSPQYVAKLTNKIKESGAKAIFSEPQLPERNAKVLAESAGVMLYVLDPNGGVAGRMKYYDLILYNARTLKKALE